MLGHAHLLQLLSIQFAIISVVASSSSPSLSNNSNENSCALYFSSLPRARGVKQFPRQESTKKLRLPFDPVLSFQLFHLAAGAYANSKSIQEQCIQSGFPESDNWKHLGMYSADCDGGSVSFFVLASTERKQLAFVFRGTDSLWQLFRQVYHGINDGMSFPSRRKNLGISELLTKEPTEKMKRPWGKIHSYFAHAFDKLWPTIRGNYCHNKDYAKYNFVFTGHSLGGALAALAAAQTRVEECREPEQITLYTFGQPRIGNYQFAMRHSQEVPNSYRIVNAQDHVAHIGPCRKKHPSMEFKKCYFKTFNKMLGADARICATQEDQRFYHQGTEVWFKNGMAPDSKPQVCEGMPVYEDIGCSVSLPFDQTSLLTYVFDHRHYYGKWVAVFGMLGCEAKEKQGNLGATELEALKKKVEEQADTLELDTDVESGKSREEVLQERMEEVGDMVDAENESDERAEVRAAMSGKNTPNEAISWRNWLAQKLWRRQF